MQLLVLKDVAWFRTKGIPYEKLSDWSASNVGSFVGLASEVDEDNFILTKYDSVRVKIGSRNVTKLPVVLDGLHNCNYMIFISKRRWFRMVLHYYQYFK